MMGFAGALAAVGLSPMVAELPDKLQADSRIIRTLRLMMFRKLRAAKRFSSIIGRLCNTFILLPDLIKCNVCWKYVRDGGGVELFNLG